MPSFVTSTPFLAVTGVIILILLIAFVASRYKVASANEALIVAGSRGAKVRDEKGQVMSSPGDRGVKVVVGGGTFIRPLLDRVGKLKLTARQINVQRADAVTSQGIKVQVQGVATFKIGRDGGVAAQRGRAISRRQARAGGLHREERARRVASDRSWER